MSLYSGKRVHSYNWTDLPIDNDVIHRVEELAKEEEAIIMTKGYPVFTWKHRDLDKPTLAPGDADEDEAVDVDVEMLKIEDINDNTDSNYVTDEDQGDNSVQEREFLRTTAKVKMKRWMM